MNIIKDCLTGIDGETYDPARVGGMAGLVTYLSLSVVAVIWKGQPFDPQSFGIGIAGVLAGFGAAVRLKSHTEPGQS